MASNHNITVVVRVHGGITKDDQPAWNWTENTMEQTLAETQTDDQEEAVFRHRSASGAERNFHSSDSISDLHQGRGTSRSLLSFKFDHVYSPSSLSADIFDTSLKDLVVSSCQGFNGTVCAYGPTGSGKTHSIVGTNEDPGLFCLTLIEIFKYISENRSEQFLLQVGYYEIDNEEIKDLLSDENNDNDTSNKKKQASEKLQIVDRPDVGPCVLNLTLVPVSTPEDALEQLLKGNRKRRQMEAGNSIGSHPATHAVLQLRIESTPNGGEGSNGSEASTTRVARLNLIDLAGSEKMKVLGNSGGAKMIMNASLLALGNVIAKLASKSSHVPYRDSKLTRLLSTSLGGNARTAIICTVRPGRHEISNALNTLRFGARAMTVVNNVRKNSVRSARSEMERFKKQIGSLRMQLSDARTSVHTLATEEENAALKKRLKEMEELLLDSNSAATREVKRVLSTEITVEDIEEPARRTNKRPSYRRKSIVFSAEAMQKAAEGINTVDGNEDKDEEKDIILAPKSSRKKRSARGRRRLSMAMGNVMKRMSIGSVGSITSTPEEETLNPMRREESKVWQYNQTDAEPEAPPPPPVSNHHPNHHPVSFYSPNGSISTSTYSEDTNLRKQRMSDKTLGTNSSVAIVSNVASSPASIKMLRQEMKAQMKTILKLQDKLAVVDEQVFDEQKKNYELSDQLRKEKLSKTATEGTCEQLQEMLKSVRGHYEDSEEKTTSRTDRVQNLLTETRNIVEERDVEIMEIKEKLKLEIAKQTIFLESEKKATTQHDLANYYFDKLVETTEAKESMERAMMFNEESRTRDIRVVINQSDTWNAMEKRVHELESNLNERCIELNQVRKEANIARRDVVSLESALVEARLIAERMEAFSEHLAQEMDSDNRNNRSSRSSGSSKFGFEQRSTPTTKLLKSLAEKSQSRVIRLTRTSTRSNTDDTTSIVNNGNGSINTQNNSISNQASLIRELTEKLRDSEFRVAGLELARELDAQQRARLETMHSDLELGMQSLQLDRRSAWTATKHTQSLASLALRELDSLRRELSSIGSRDSNRMEQIKQIKYVNNGLDAMGAPDDRSVQALNKDIQFFKPLLREELAYTVDELVLLNERLHVSFVYLFVNIYYTCLFF